MKTGKSAAQLTLALCAAFILLTIAAMFAYPGGTFVNPNTRGYLFFENFFSDLGMTRSYSDAANTVSMLLFVTALFCAGSGIILFFARFAARFPSHPHAARIGSACGILTGICFFGVALTPQDLFAAHDWFSTAAFLSLGAASAIYGCIILLAPTYPQKFALVFGALSVMLLAYIALFLFGPPLASRAGIVIQATGQKIIVYAAILSLGIQAYHRSA